MADFGFANKSNSSDFSSTGDKVNEVFGDLLLNRTELETMITSLKRRQYGATPPANPNTGDIWECSTTGGGYTATVVYRYNGSAWAELIASAVNIPNRNTVIQGKVTAAGAPDLFEAGTGLACKLNATATPAIFAFMNGNSTSLGTVDIVAAVSADAATFWSSLPTSSTVYLYVDYTTGTVSGWFTTLAPVYQNIAPTHSAGLHWLDFNTGKVWSSDGSAWTQRNRIFVGTATTDGTGVTGVNVYPYNTVQSLCVNDIIANGPWIDIRSYGASELIDNTPIFESAIADLPEGSTIYLPPGIWHISSRMAWDKRISLRGEGELSILFLDVGAGNTGIFLGKDAAYMLDLKWSDFSIYGDAGACAVGLYVKKVNNSRFENIHLNIGATIEVQLDDTICNHYNFISSGNSSPVVTTGVWGDAIVAATNTGTATVCNANIFDCLIEGGTGRGLYINTAGDDGNNEIRGVYEGIPGYGIHLKGCKGAHLHDIHLERGTGGNELVLEGTNHVTLGANIAVTGSADPDVKLIGALGTVINGLRCNRLSIDAACMDTRIEEINTMSGIIDLGERTTQLFVRGKQTSIGAEKVCALSDFRSIAVNGSAERWNATNTIPPGCWGYNGAAPTWAREATIVKHGKYSAKVTLSATAKAALTLASAADTAQLPVTAVITSALWVFIPTTGGQDITATVLWGSGATQVIDVITARDVWTKLSFSFLARGTTANETSSQLILSTSESSAIAYLDGFSVVPSFVGSPVLYTPNPDEFPVYTGSATWAGDSIPNASYRAFNITVPGAVVGMAANVSADVTLGDLCVSGSVNAADTVRAVLYNLQGGPAVIAASTWTAIVTKVF